MVLHSLRARLFRQAKKNNKRNFTRTALGSWRYSRLRLEPLESRSLLAVVIWDGGGGNALWTNGMNWQGDVAPMANDQLQFPDGAMQLTNNNDFVATTFQSIAFTGANGGYNLTNQSLVLTGGVTSNNTSGVNQISLGVQLTGNQLIVATNAGGILRFTGGIALNGNATFSGAGDTEVNSNINELGGARTVTKTGTGELVLAGINNYSGITTLQAGTLTVNGNINFSDIVMTGGLLAGTGTVREVTATGGAIGPGDNAPGILTSADGVSFNNSTAFNVQLNGLTVGTNYDQLSSFGDVTLGNANLAATAPFAYTPGQSVTIVNNNTANPINGIFNGLPENTVFNIGAQSFRITYVGGNGNDVVLTRVGQQIINGTNLDDIFRVVRQAGDPTMVDVILNNATTTFALAGLGSLILNGLGGNDLFIIDSSNGLITPPAGIRIDGGPGFDRLRFEQTGGNLQTTDVYSVGPNPGQGSSVITGPTGTQTVQFENLEPVLDLVPANQLTVNATPADNAINYTIGSVATNGLVTIDNFEPIEFSNKDQLIINDGLNFAAQAGSDEININNPSRPTGATPGGLKSILVNAGDPVASDVVIVSGREGQPDIITFQSGTNGDGTVTFDAASNLPNVSIRRAELAIISGGGNDSDQLRVQSLNGTHTIFYTPGPDIDSGSVRVSAVAGHLPLEFKSLGTNGTVSFITDPDGDRGDALVVNGTSTSDTFSVDGPNDRIVLTTQFFGNTFKPILTPGIRRLTLNGLDGDDQFNLTGTLPYAQGVVIDGGNPSASDSLTLTGTAGVENVTVNINEDTIGGFGGDPVSVFGVEHVRLNGNGGADTLALSGTGKEDTFDFAPEGNGVGELTVGGFPLTDYNSFTGGISVNGINGFDHLTVTGTSGNDRFDLVQPAAGTLNVTLNAFTQNFTFTNVEAGGINALAGDDIIRINSTAAGNNSLRYDVDGGPSTTSDRLAVDATNLLALYRKGQDDSTGSITIGARQPVVFVNVERIDAVGTGANLVVFKHDPFESNDTLATATHLGSGETINVDPTIDPGADVPFGLPGDEDWFRVVAEKTGTLDFQVFFRQQAGLPTNGNIDIEVRDAAGNLIAGFGTNDATDDERVRIPAVQGQTYYLRVLGAINVYSITVVNLPPPVPTDLELLDNPVGDPPPLNSDTGRSQFDNTTRDNTPTLVFRLDDGFFLHDLPGNNANDTPPDQVIPIPFQAAAGTAGYRIAIFDEGNSPPPGTQTGTAPQTPLGFATATAQEGVYTFTVPAALSDGSHFLTARVQMVDPANPQQTGFGPRSVALEIVVDTAAPTVFFGLPGDPDDGLVPEPGVIPQPGTFVDRKTNDTTPTLFGTAEANSIIRLFADLTPDNGVDNFDVQLGLAVAEPLDGTNQFPNGQWTLTSTVDLNDPDFFPVDGVRRLLVTAEDLAGNVTVAPFQSLNIFIDTQGPRVTDVFPNEDPDFDLFETKPTTQGPTPLVNSISITVQDFPARLAEFPNPAVNPDVAEAFGNYVLRGDAVGIIAINDIEFDPDPIVVGQPATGTITLFFAKPLPDDRYTLIVKDSLVDDVGNALDGESNASEPIGTPNFPSGNGQPGGDFIARFTVDSRPELGTVSAGTVYIDINGNFINDPQNLDAVNRDISFTVSANPNAALSGFASDVVFAGNFAAPGGAADGFDKLAAYGQVGSVYRWLIDTDNDGVMNLRVNDPASVNGYPVAGRFDASAANGDEVGLFTGTTWHFDTNHDFQVDQSLKSALRGYPIVGDFDNDGFDDLATWADDRFTFDLTKGTKNSWDGVADGTIQFGFQGVRERPVSADMNQDGIDDVGLWVPDRSGATGDEFGEWYFLVSRQPNDESFVGTLNAINHPFEPVPFGNDLYAQYGDQFAAPVLGNFDPPVASSSTASWSSANPNSAASSGNSSTSASNGTGTSTSSSNSAPAATTPLASSSTNSSSTTGNNTTPAPVSTLAAIKPTITVDDAVVVEGTGGASALSFTVHLSQATSNPVVVKYATTSGTAAARKDYAPTSGAVTFAAGTTTQQITVPVVTDSMDESDESISVKLSKPKGGVLADSKATGTIQDDDAAPTVTISNATVTETNKGRTTAKFTVSLSSPSAQRVTVEYATADGTATAPADYRAVSPTRLVFAPGVTQKTISVSVAADRLAEGDETFLVQLRSAINATLGNTEGVGTIVDNDMIAVAQQLMAATTPEASVVSRQTASDVAMQTSIYGPRKSAPTPHDQSLQEYLGDGLYVVWDS